MSEFPTDVEFPLWGLLPKKETGIVSFLSKFPEYDGRGTVIAILDSGVDPGAPGLQKTSDGKVKVIHRFDCSGCGDVNTSTIVQPKESYITGLTGRKLKIPLKWENPTNNYRIGVKLAYDLYPERLQERITAEYKEKIWDENHRKAVAEANRQVIEFDTKHTSKALSESEKLEKEDLEAKLDLLNNVGKKFCNNGPVYDCVLFHNGENWQCCVDTTEEGDLEKCTLLGEYSITHEYAPLTPYDKLNYSMNVHEDGNLLELVGLCSSHGTHVASIAAANFPDNPQECGVAPGAQIVSLTIGDGRLRSMETGTALVRAMIKIMELSRTQKVDVINMSYGEHGHVSNVGRVGELMTEVINKYGVIWVASAGNHGPALNTVGTPPDICEDIVLGVGAYVSPDMMVAAYSMRQRLPGMPFTWSSRGPCADGGLGVTICAPGGAVTSVPNCTLRYSQLMNGTSMASPHVAGAVSILLSGLIQQNLSYSPYSIKRAIENTATMLPGVEVFAQGSGLLQVDKAFDHLVTYNNATERNVRFQVSCGNSNTKGIYLRNKTINSTSVNVTIEPHFLDSNNVDCDVKINFNMKLALVCNASFVSCPTHLDISNGSRVFALRLDPMNLNIGVHHTFIDAFDVSCVAKGPVFKISITVIQPVEITSPKHSLVYHAVIFKPNTIRRHFYVVPNFATWALLRLATPDQITVGRFVVHAMHLLPNQNCKTLEANKAITVNPNSDVLTCFQVKSNAILEVVIAKYWANVGEVNLDYAITFYGVKPNQPAIMMHPAEGIHTFEVSCLRNEEISPSITLKNSVQILRPVEAKVSPLTKRDVVPPNRQIYELVLVYNFSITKSTEITPNVTLLSDVLYESDFESQLWMLFDSNKQLLGCGDAYPSKYTVKVEKGDYTIKLHIRYEKKEQLDKLTETPMLLQQKLNSNITLDVYSSFSQALLSGKKAHVMQPTHLNSIPFYIAPLPSDKFLAKSNNPAHMLTGSITYCKDETAKKVDVYPFKYILIDSSAKKSPNGNTNNSEKSKVDECKEAIRDLKVQYLSKMDIATAEKLYSEYLSAYPEHPPLHTAYLQVLDPLDVKRAFPSLPSDNLQFTKEAQKKLITMCDKAIESINEETILAYTAIKTDLRADATKIKTSMDQKKNLYLECLCRKGITLCRLILLGDNVDETLEALSNLWKSVVKFVDPNDSKVTTNYVLYFAMWHARVYNQYGRLLKFLMKLQEEKPVKELEEKVIELCKLNEWDYMASYFLRNLPLKFPNAYRQF